MFFLFFHKTDSEVIPASLPMFPCPYCGSPVNAKEVFKQIHKGFFLLIPYKFVRFKVVCENCGKMIKLPNEFRRYLND